MNKIINLLTNVIIAIVFGSYTLCCYAKTGATCPEKPFPLNDPEIDFRIMICTNFTWTDAFNNLHAKISKEYSYTKYDNIDWNALYTKYQPLIAAAENEKNETKYYQAMLNYLSEVHDWHVYLSPETIEAKKIIDGVNKEHIGGSYGFIITATDDGKYVASYVAAQGPAALAGLNAGDEIVSWNNLPIKQAVSAVDITWTGGEENQPSTTAGINYEKIRLLTRTKIGNQVKIGCRNPATASIKYITLTAINDSDDTLKRTYLYPNENITKENYVSGEILKDSGYGYIKVISEDHEEADAKKSISYQKFHDLIKTFNDKQVPGVILDLRGNNGGGTHQNLGLDLPLDFAGFFNSSTQFYANFMCYNEGKGTFVPCSGYEKFYITPQDIQYTGSVVVLTDIGTLCAGEDIVNGMHISKNITTLSFYPNTRGSHGPNPPLVLMPGGYLISYNVGYLTDQNGNILIEANKNHQGGVKTDVKIPMTATTAIDIYTNGKDPALKYAINWLNSHLTCNDNCKQRLQKMLDDYRIKYQIPALAMSVSFSSAQPTLDFFSGTTTKNGNTAINNNTLFEVGSLTKSFTAAIILQLEADGKLSINDTVEKWLPEYHAWKDITIKQLMNMTGGIKDYEIPAFQEKIHHDPEKYWSKNSITSWVYGNQPNIDFPSGANWNYSNTNYTILGLIIEKATHKTIVEIMQEKIFKPLKLENTIYDDNLVPATLANFAHGYDDRDDIFSGMDDANISIATQNTEGGIISTANTLNKWVRALFSGKVLPSTQFQEMTSVVCVSNNMDPKHTCKAGSTLPYNSNQWGYNSGLLHNYNYAPYGDLWWQNGETVGHEAAFFYIKNKNFIITFTGSTNNAMLDNDFFGGYGDLVSEVYSYFFL